MGPLWIYLFHFTIAQRVGHECEVVGRDALAHEVVAVFCKEFDEGFRVSFRPAALQIECGGTVDVALCPGCMAGVQIVLHLTTSMMRWNFQMSLNLMYPFNLR